MSLLTTTSLISAVLFRTYQVLTRASWRPVVRREGVFTYSTRIKLSRLTLVRRMPVLASRKLYTPSLCSISMIAYRRVIAKAAWMLNTLSFIVTVVVAAASHYRLPNILYSMEN